MEGAHAHLRPMDVKEERTDGYMLEFERLVMESVTTLQCHLVRLQCSAAPSKQVLKL